MVKIDAPSMKLISEKVMRCCGCCFYNLLEVVTTEQLSAFGLKLVTDIGCQGLINYQAVDFYQFGLFASMVYKNAGLVGVCFNGTMIGMKMGKESAMVFSKN
ncbi:unnamed protein product [Vicia faba]|uniref:Uncharacterized protein n=1 Tax=Vicia faba TaxID=3906 RepID=A0AAV1ADN7_VICFA|nr:unnamed protein product [Vicia faba]